MSAVHMHSNGQPVPVDDVTVTDTYVATPLTPIQGSFQQYFAFGIIAFVLGLVLQTYYGQSRYQGDKSGTRSSQAVSRNQSLIKTNVAPQDLRPSDVLIERFVAWEAIVGQLIVYFEVKPDAQ